MGFLDRGRDKKRGAKYDFAVLALRLTAGGLLAGHGAQKLFGSFGGPGLEETEGMMESMGITPSETWAKLAGLSEFGGGMLTALGLFHPVGPIATMGAMGVATRTVHRGKPIWVTSGGAELPVTNMAIATALTLLGPGRHSLDRLLGIHMPKTLALLTAIGVGAGIAVVEAMPRPEPDTGEDEGEPAPA